jgi:hypothetical protein
VNVVLYKAADVLLLISINWWLISDIISVYNFILWLKCLYFHFLTQNVVTVVIDWSEVNEVGPWNTSRKPLSEYRTCDNLFIVDCMIEKQQIFI